MEVELAGSDGDSDDATDWEADASESDDEAPAPRPPDAHPRAPEAPEDAAPPPKRRKVSYREAQAAKQRREARVLVHKRCVERLCGALLVHPSPAVHSGALLVLGNLAAEDLDSQAAHATKAKVRATDGAVAARWAPAS